MRKMPKVPFKEIRNRIDLLIKSMNENDVDLSIIVQNVDRYYFTGTMQNGVLLVTKNGGTKLFIRRTLETAIEESSMEEIAPYYGTKTVKEYAINNKIKVKKLGLEMDVLPSFLYVKFRQLFPDAEIYDISMDIKRIRMVKSEYEINLIREAAGRLDKVMSELKNFIKPGIEEKDILPDYVRLIVSKDSSPCVRTRQYNMEAIQKYILSGESAFRQSYLDSPSSGGTGVTYAFPGGAGEKVIRSNEPIMVDLVMNYEGYNSDCTRVFAISSIEKKFLHAHEVSRMCHDVFKDLAAKRKNIKEITKSIRKVVEHSDFEPYFMGGVKFIGHGIGLELDEIPVITDSFDEYIQPGMVIAFEPKFIFEDGAVGYETTYLIGDHDVEPLNKFPESITIL